MLKVRRHNSPRDERGQTLAEFALVLPVLMTILLAILQFGTLFKNYLTVTDAVRAGARKGAVSRHATSPKATCEGAVADAARDLGVGTGLEPLCTSTWKPGEDVVVTATFPYSINIPILNIPVKTGRFSSTTTERVE